MNYKLQSIYSIILFIYLLPFPEGKGPIVAKTFLFWTRTKINTLEECSSTIELRELKLIKKKYNIIIVCTKNFKVFYYIEQN